MGAHDNLDEPNQGAGRGGEISRQTSQRGTVRENCRQHSVEETETPLRCSQGIIISIQQNESWKTTFHQVVFPCEKEKHKGEQQVSSDKEKETQEKHL